MDDHDLLHAYLSHASEDAFRELVQRHINVVYGAALRRLDGDAHGAADVTQSTFEILAKKAASLTSHPTLTGWLFSTAHFIAARTRRDQQRRRTREQEAQLMNEMMSDPGAATRWEELRPLLDDAILELAAPDREAVMLRYFEGRPFADIGRLLRSSEDTARKRVERALEKLERLLAKQGITSTAGALALALSNQPLVAVPSGLATTIASQALVGATLAAKTAGVGLGTFMLTSKTGMAVAAIALLAAGTAIYEAQDVQATRRELARLSAERETMMADVARSGETARAAEARARAAENALQAARALSAPPSLPRGPTLAPRSSNALDAVASGTVNALDRLSDPSVQRASLNLQRANLRLDFGPLYQRERLSPEKITAFENALVDQAAAMTEVRLAAKAQGVDPTDPAITALSKPIIDEAVGKIRQLLGAEGFQDYVDYTKIIRARSSSVDPLAGSLYYTDTPLTAAQADQLVGVISVNTTAYGWSGSVANGNDTDWPKVIAQAQAFLAPRQIETLQALRRKADAQQEFGDAAAKVQTTATLHPTTTGAKSPQPGGD